MNSERLRFVVDASVAMKLFVIEPLSDIALALFDKLADDVPAEFFVPDLFYIECTNVLLKYRRRFGRSLEDTMMDIEDLKQLALKSIPTLELLEDALLLADKKNITAYDACYLALGERLGVPVITADRSLSEACDGALWLGEYRV